MAPTIPFDRGARYGAAVVGMLFSTYLAIATDFSAILQSETYAGTIRNDVPAVNIFQFVLILLGMSGSLAVLPTSGMRRVGGVTVVWVTLCLWATFGLERGVGNISHPVAFWAFVLNQGFVVLLAAVGGWVIARGRHPLAWLVVLVAVVPPIVSPILIATNFTTGGYSLVIQGLVIVLGLGAVWAAAWIDRAVGRRDGDDSAAVASAESGDAVDVPVSAGSA